MNNILYNRKGFTPFYLTSLFWNAKIDKIFANTIKITVETNMIVATSPEKLELPKVCNPTLGKIWTALIIVSERVPAKIGNKIKKLANKVSTRIKAMLNPTADPIFCAFILIPVTTEIYNMIYKIPIVVEPSKLKFFWI